MTDLTQATRHRQTIDAIAGTKKQLRDGIRHILNNSPAGPLDPFDTAIVIAVAAGHPKAADKFGPGIDHITIDQTGPHGSRHFTLHRTDGTTVDISYTKAVTGNGPDLDADIASACRHAVADDVAIWRNRQLAANPTCQITGQPVDRNTAVVHHAPPMLDALVNQWATTVGREQITAGLFRPTTGGVFLHPDHQQSWLDWHNTNANLQLVHTIANSKIEEARQAAQ